ncbi:MAG: hypothetical protein IBJ18_06635 [Phycisphaerales bacterium]|nr:hypothetical protein [Phycisphaerales bacterium]
MMRPFFRAAAVVSAGWLSLASCFAAAPKSNIADLVSPQTVYLVTVDNASAAKEQWEKSGLGKLFTSDQFKAVFEAISDEAKKAGAGEANAMRKWLEDAGVKVDELPYPTGTTGVAFIAHVDAKTNLPELRFVAVAQFGDQADKFAEAVDKVLAEMEKKKLATITDQEMAGVQGKKVVLNKPEKPKKDEKKADEEDEMDFDLEGDSRPFEEGFYARSGETFIFGATADTVESVLDHLTGKAKGDTLSSTATYELARRQQPPNTIASLTWYIEPISAMVKDLKGKLPERNWEKPESSLAGMVRSFQDETGSVAYAALGIMGTKAVTASVALETETAVAEARLSMLTTNRKGLLTLLEPFGSAPEAPAFAGADAAGLATFKVKFNKIFDTARETLKSMPAESRQQLEPTIMQAESFAGPVLANLGPEVYLVTNIDQPLGPDSSHIFGAAKLSDATPLVNLLTAFGAQAGLKPREFEGHTIYDPPQQAFGPQISLGIGLGYLFVGSTKDVENALRTGGRTDGPRLNTEARFKAAGKVTNPESFAFGYTDMAQTIKQQYWLLQNPDLVFESQTRRFRDMGMDPESFGMKKPEKPKWVEKLPPVETVLQYVGDAVLDSYWNEDGLQVRFRYLRPAK